MSSLLSNPTKQRKWGKRRHCRESEEIIRQQPNGLLIFQMLWSAQQCCWKVVRTLWCTRTVYDVKTFTIDHIQGSAHQGLEVQCSVRFRVAQVYTARETYRAGALRQ